MYTAEVLVEGEAPILQHGFGAAAKTALKSASKQRTGTPDYSLEWMDTMYQNRDGYLAQPGIHFEQAMKSAATNFKMTGKRGKTWKKAFVAYVVVVPELILHLRDGAAVKAPGAELVSEPTDFLSVNVMRVVVQRAAVARARLQIATGWQLKFNVQVIDDQLPAEVLNEVLVEAGRAEGVGDYRPKYGRFRVVEFKHSTTS